MNLNLGRVIKRLRIEHSITQEELAEYLGISFQAVSKWETGTTLPDITLLPKLAAFFGIRIDELFSINHEDEMELNILLFRICPTRARSALPQSQTAAVNQQGF